MINFDDVAGIKIDALRSSSTFQYSSRDVTHTAVGELIDELIITFHHAYAHMKVPLLKIAET